MFSQISEAELLEAKKHFPKVAVTCDSCDGCGTVDVAHGEINCPLCGNPDDAGDIGDGVILRDMEPREEHLYLMLLVQKMKTNTTFVDLLDL